MQDGADGNYYKSTRVTATHCSVMRAELTIAREVKIIKITTVIVFALTSTSW